DLLVSTLAVMRPDEEATETLEDELIRLWDLALDRPQEAEALLARRLERNPLNLNAIVALASLKRRRGDLDGYRVLRERQARQIPESLGALVLCHLAEL